MELVFNVIMMTVALLYTSLILTNCLLELMQCATFSGVSLLLQDIDKSEHSEETKQLLRQHVNKEAVLLTCKLRHKRTDKLVVIGNTHLTWTKFTALDISCMQVRVSSLNNISSINSIFTKGKFLLLLVM